VGLKIRVTAEITGSASTGYAVAVRGFDTGRGLKVSEVEKSQADFIEEIPEVAARLVELVVDSALSGRLE
jgi:hypothetical protein